MDYSKTEEWILTRLPSYQAIGKKAYNPIPAGQLSRE